MISELINLKEYIISEVRQNADITNRDIAPEEYPFIKILPDRDITNYFMTKKMVTADFPITLKIIVARGNEIDAISILEKMLQKLNQFNSEKGHKFTDTISPEYLDNTYEINVGYNLKLITQDTGG